jgi:signal transduction histidine kinase/ligand-binding sensor domain-containing protein/DNA-binding response OmpR family regulator
LPWLLALAVSLAFALAPLAALAQMAPTQGLSLQAHFSHLRVSDGLSQNTITAIVQDKQGYLWLGTEDGLNRFDGYEVKRLALHGAQGVSNANASPPALHHSLANNAIRSLFVDSADYLWIGTKGGLHRYDPVSEQLSLIANSAALNIMSIMALDTHTLVIGSANHGLFYLQPSSARLSPVPLLGSAAAAFEQTTLRVVKAAPDGGLWLGTNEGLFTLDRHHNLTEISWPRSAGTGSARINDILLLKAHSSRSQLPSRDIPSRDIPSRDIPSPEFTGRDTAALIATDHGLYHVTSTGQVLRHWVHDNLDSKALPHNIVNRLIRGSRGHIWLASQGGLSRFNIARGLFETFKQQADYNTSLGANDVLSLYEDNQANLWIGTVSAGLDSLHLPSLDFGLRYATKDNLECLSNNHLFNVMLSSNNSLWLAAYGKGLHQIQWPNGPCTWYRQPSSDADNTEPPTPTRRISSNNISANSLFEDNQGQIWFGSHQSALNQITPTSQTIKHFYPEQSPAGLSSSSVRKIVAEANGDLWMATDGGGLNRYRSDSHQFNHFSADKYKNQTLSSPYLYDLVLDSQYLWIATETAGLERLDLKTKTVQNFGRETRGETGTPKKIYSLIDDNDGHLWLGTQGEGLVKFNKSNFTSEYYTTEHGLANNTLYALEQDNAGMLWLASNRGISKFNPKTKAIENYRAADGLQGDEFNVGSHYSKELDLLFFVGSNGFNAFSPGDIKPDAKAPQVVVNDFLLFNRPAPHLFDRRSAHVSLTQAQNLISFEFAGIHFVDPSRHQYQYQLEGFDSQWRTTSNQRRFATYTNLDAGEYTFKVKASNHHGVWSEPTAITVTVLPPLWLTWWAKLGYLLASLLLAMGLYQYRTASLRARNVQLERGVAQRTLEIIDQKQKIEQLLASKTREFDNISHEFRTPLAVILGRVEQRLAQNQTLTNQRAFEAIDTVAKRLAIMVDDVIEMGRTFDSAQASEKSRLCLSHLCVDVGSQMHEYAALKKQRLHTDITAGLYVDCLPKAIEKMLNNLVANAIKYTQEQGDIHLSLRPLQSHFVELIVKDNGPGIALEYQQRVFERFYRIAESADQPGSGIGLALVQEVVKAHRGQISLESAPKQGCRFRVLLPLSAGCDEDTDAATDMDTDVNTENTESATIRQTAPHTKGTITPETVPETQPQYGLGAPLEPIEAPMPSREPTLSTEKACILVVEDNPELSALLIDQLSLHYQVVAAKNGRQGLQLAEMQVPSLILSDINMPYMNGYQLVSHVKQLSATSHIPVVLLTAKNDVSSRIQGYEHQADSYLGKPYLLAELLAVIEAQLNNRKRLQQYYKHSDPTALLPPPSGLDCHSIKAIDKCKTLVMQAYQDPNLSVQDLVAAAHLSERQLARKFQAILGITPLEFITQYRLAKAKTLLQQGHRISQVSLDVGFSSANYFSRQYKKKYGVSPSKDKP